MSMNEAPWSPRRTVDFTKDNSKKERDLQIICEGNLKQGDKSDYITFRMKILAVDVICIVTIPGEGKTKAPVYVKFKLDWGMNQPPGSVVIDE